MRRGGKRMKEREPNPIGAKIRSLRRQLGLTQEQLGERASIHYSYVGQVERGDKMPSLRTLKKIASALNTDLRYLLEDTPPYLPAREDTETAFAELRDLLGGRHPAYLRVGVDLVRAVVLYLTGVKQSPDPNVTCDGA